MRISAKGRYALASTISMAEQYRVGEYITVISIAEKLGISKIYLEQVFSLLKRGNIVTSIKGSQGGYQLTRSPNQITLLDILSAVESSLFEPTEDTVDQKAPHIETAMRLTAFEVVSENLMQTMKTITLDKLVNEAQKHLNNKGYMYFI